MEIRWGKDRKKTLTGIPKEVTEDAAETVVREQNFHSAIDEIVSNHAKEGGFDDLEGKGKPLDLKGERNANDYLARVMKNANVLPDWLELQHEIRDNIAGIVRLLEQNRTNKIDQELVEINLKIKKYNQKCPTPLLQKPKITLENILSQFEKWK